MSQWVKNLGERLKALELGEQYIRRSWLYYPEKVDRTKQCASAAVRRAHRFAS
jgi:hypothetical protein